jgi:hypothetical protein
MEITFVPFEGLNDTIEKYGVFFEVGKPVNVNDERLAKRLLTNPYFVTSKKVDGVEVMSEAPKPKRGRPRKTETIDSVQDEE